jgi:thiosulfate/3-mercaptopyruvate sulfurtransferase
MNTEHPGTYVYPDLLVSTDWLAANLSDPKIRLYDCTTHLIHISDPEAGVPYRVESGRADYDQEHIPGAAFIDLQKDLSDQTSPLRFTCPDNDTLIAAFAALGVTDDCTTVLYSQTTPQWATRIWWMLRHIGFDNACVLDGGLSKWKLEGRTLETHPNVYPSGVMHTVPRSGLMVDKEEILRAIDGPGTCTINALRKVQHAGQDNSQFGNYGRPGHITGSINVPTAELIDEQTTAFLPARHISAVFSRADVSEADRILTYCGGGIAASTTAMLLTMLGYQNVGLYDASLSEWAPDATLPMETLPANPTGD